MILADQKAQLEQLVRLRERRVDRALARLRHQQVTLDNLRNDHVSCVDTIGRLSNERRALRLEKAHSATASAADWVRQEQYGAGLHLQIADQRNRLLHLENEIKAADVAVEQARQQWLGLRQKLQALMAQAGRYGALMRREKSQKEQRKQDEQAQGMMSNASNE